MYEYFLRLEKNTFLRIKICLKQSRKKIILSLLGIIIFLYCFNKYIEVKES